MHVKSYVERDFADRIKVRDLKIGRLLYVFWVGSVSSHELLKAENFLWLEAKETRQKEKSERFEAWEDLIHHCRLKDTGDRVTKNIGGVKELKEAPGWQPARKWGLQFKSLKELNAANNLNEFRSGFSPRASSKSPWWLTPWFWPCEIQSRGTRKSTWTCNLQSYEIINVGCFK